MDRKNRLSQRENEVTRLIVAGLSRKEAANILFVEQDTIRQHMKSIFKKLGVRNSIQLTNRYISYMYHVDTTPETIIKSKITLRWKNNEAERNNELAPSRKSTKRRYSTMQKHRCTQGCI